MAEKDHFSCQCLLWYLFRDLDAGISRPSIGRIPSSFWTMVARSSSSNDVRVVLLEDLGGGGASATDDEIATPLLPSIPLSSQPCVPPSAGIGDCTTCSHSTLPTFSSSANSLMELACEDDRQIVRVPLVFDEAKMKKRIEKDIKRGRLTRVRSSDSFLEGKAETSRRVMRSYLSFGHESGTSLNELSRQLRDHDGPRRLSSENTLGEGSKIEALHGKNETFDQLGRLQRASAATSVGRALLSR